MSDSKKPTKYTPAERLSEEEVKRQVMIFDHNETLNEFLGRIPAIFIIVNKYRQVVYMNKGALEFTGLGGLTTIIGKRPGEMLGCIHSQDEEGECGTSEACTYCGAVNAVIESQKGMPTMKECRLILGPNEDSYDLRVWASPLSVDNEEFIALTLQDISDEKRRKYIEEIFFHDILNTITGLLGNIQLLINYGDKVDQKNVLDRALMLVTNLSEEVQSQRLLMEAEKKAYTVQLTNFNSVDLIKEIINTYQNNEIAQERALKIDENAESIEIHSDRTLLRRVILNMVKNALEAIDKGETVTVGCNRNATDMMEFWVHNPGFIPRNVQLQIFQRSFSTKGKSRGLGTYSMKLLSNILEGKVSFTTSEDKGTKFKTCYPV